LQYACDPDSQQKISVHSDQDFERALTLNIKSPSGETGVTKNFQQPTSSSTQPDSTNSIPWAFRSCRILQFHFPPTSVHNLLNPSRTMATDAEPTQTPQPSRPTLPRTSRPVSEALLNDKVGLPHLE